VGTNQHYCWHCFIELTTDQQNRIASIHQIEEDGSLSSLNDLFLTDDGASISM